MDKWEYAHLNWESAGMGKLREVTFSHREGWSKIGGGELMKTLGRLGEEGFELVAHSLDSRNWNNFYFKRRMN